MKAYFAKMRGCQSVCPPRPHYAEIIWSWTGALLGIAAVAALQERMFPRVDQVMIVGSFGASAVLIYGAIKSPLAPQPDRWAYIVRPHRCELL